MGLGPRQPVNFNIRCLDPAPQAAPDRNKLFLIFIKFSLNRHTNAKLGKRCQNLNNVFMQKTKYTILKTETYFPIF